MNGIDSGNDQAPESAPAQKPTDQKGNFTQVPNEVIEYLMNRKKADLTSREYAIMFFLIRELQGWAYEYKPIEIAEYVEGTGMEKQNLIPALSCLIDERRLVTKVKLPGFRTPLYGFNKEVFGRILASQEPKKFYSAGNGKVINLMTFKVLNSMPLEVINSMTEKKRLAALEAASRASKDTSNTSIKISIKELRDFVDTQRRQTKTRWEAIINSVLTDYPGDEFLLWCAIDLVHKTREDLFGRPIKRSIIGLFEGDWQVMRVAMEAKLNQMEMAAIKAQKKAENEKRLEAARNEKPAPKEGLENVSEMLPWLKKYATMGQTQ